MRSLRHNLVARCVVAWLLLATQALADITHSGTTGQTLYARVQTGTSTFVAAALTEGSSGGLGIYTVTDASLVTAGLSSIVSPSLYNFTIRVGAPSTTANDAIVGSNAIGWRAGVELPLLLPKDLALLSIGRDGAVATSNRGYISSAGYAALWASAPQHLIYVRTTGNDANTGTDPGDAYLTIQKAIDEINAAGNYTSTKIDFTGSHNIAGTRLVIPANTWLSGDGSTARGGTSNISCSAASAPTMVSAATGGNVILSGFKITSTVASGSFALPIGYSGAGTASRNVVVINVDTDADSDAAYFSDSTNCNGWWRFYNCGLVSKWDSTTIIQENATHISEFYDCTITAVGPSAVGSATDTRAIAGAGGTQRLFNCTISGTGHVGGKLAYGVHARGSALIEIYGGTVAGPASQPTDGYDFGQTDRGQIVSRSATNTGSTSGNVIVMEDGLDWSKLRNKLTTNALTNTTVSGGGGASSTVDNTEVVESRIIKLSDRNDGTTVGVKPIRTRVGEPLPWWIDTSGIAGGRWLSDVSSATSSTPAELSITSDGVNRELAVIWLNTSAAVPGTTYTVTVDIVPAAGQLIKAKVLVQILND